jgi:cysteine-rich repeat protein
MIASAASAVHFDVGSATGAPGESVIFSIVFDTEGLAVAGVQLDLAFDPLTPIVECSPGVTFRPSGCTPGINCTSIRFITLNFSGIPDGPVRTCTVAIDDDAPDAAYPLSCSNAGAATPSGGDLPATCSDGAVTVLAPVCGNGILEIGEICDTGDSPTDCCSATCDYEPDGFLCNDGDPLTTSECVAGACVVSIGADKLLIRTPPSRPSGNSVALLSGDAGLKTPQLTVEDPRCPPLGSGSIEGGAALSVHGLGGSFTIDLPCLNWSANAAGTRYRYRDATGETCRSVLIRDGRQLKAVCKGPHVGYSLGAAQGDVQVSLTTGAPSEAREYCFTFGPTTATVASDGTNGRSYKALRAAPSVCP